MPQLFLYLFVAFFLYLPNVQANSAPYDTEIIDLQKKYQDLHTNALNGDPKAQHQFAVMCMNGEGATRDPIEAVKWFRKAAEAGLAESQVQLALALQVGNGVGQDNLEAFKWLHAAANQNSASAQYMLANFYATGTAVKKDKSKAYELYAESAKNGYTKSMLKQADMLIFEDGVKKNVYEGLLLYARAAELGDYHAKAKLPSMENRKLCFFSAKTQLFGQYFKCVTRNELHKRFMQQDAKVISGRNSNTVKYDSSTLLQGSSILELNEMDDHSIARLAYVFKKNNQSPTQKITISFLKDLLSSKYGENSEKEGVENVGTVKYKWILPDGIEILLHEKSQKSDILLEYIIPEKLAKLKNASRPINKNNAQPSEIDSTAF